MIVDVGRNPKYRRTIRRAWWLTGLLALVCMARLGLLDRALISPVSSLGILDLQFAGSVEAWNVIRDTWDTLGVLHVARESLFTDFPFMVLYTANFMLGIAMWGTSPSARPMMGVAAACVPFDAAENLLQLGMLESGATTTSFAWNATFVVVKICCVIAVVLYLGAVVWRGRRSACRQSR